MHLYRNMHSDLNSWSLYQILRQIQDRERKIQGSVRKMSEVLQYIKKRFYKSKNNKIKKQEKHQKYIDRKKNLCYPMQV